MFTTAGQLVSAFEDNYKSQITQSYNRVVDIGTVAFQFFSQDIFSSRPYSLCCILQVTIS